MILFADYNTLIFSFKSFVLLIGLLEIFALSAVTCSVLLMHLDHYDSSKSTGHNSRALLYLNIGSVPALVVLSSALLAGFWSYWHPVAAYLHHGLQSPLSNLFVVPSVYCLRLLRCIIPVK